MKTNRFAPPPITTSFRSIRQLLLPLFLFIALSTNAQDKRDTAGFVKRNFVFWNASSAFGDIIGMDNLWLVLGYEKDFKNKICANLSVGYSFSQPSQKGGLLTVPYTVKNGFNISAEIKKRITDRLYIGGHLFFQNTMATGTETVLDYITETPVLLSHYKDISYSVDRSDMAFHVKFGKRCVFKGGITIDNSIGLGIRYISSQSIGKQSGDINYHSNYFETPYSKQYDDGAAFFPSFVYHLKIGFSF